MSNLTDEEALDHLHGYRVVSAFVELCEVDSSRKKKAIYIILEKNSAVFNEISQRLRTKSKKDKEEGKLDNYPFSYHDFFHAMGSNDKITNSFLAFNVYKLGSVEHQIWTF